MSAKRTSTTSPSKKTPYGVLIFAIIGLAGLVIWIATAMQPAQKTSALPLEVSVADTLKKRQDGALILDVREQSEWNTVHIPGATLIPLGDLEKRLTEVPKDRDIVVVCRSGNRSATGRDILKNAGYTQVTSMAGGMNQWQTAGYPTVTGP